MIILYIIILALAIWINYFVAKQFQSAAADKGYIGDKFFHLPFWLGLPGWFLVAALPDRGNAGAQTTGKSAAQIKAHNNVSIDSNAADLTGTCQLCGKESCHLTSCKIVDNLGTRYRNICDNCLKEINS